LLLVLNLFFFVAHAAAPLEPGMHNFSLQHQGQQRTYMVYVPRTYKPEIAQAVVFAFHGGGGDMHLQAGDHYGLTQKADSAGFIAVFPNGYSRFPGGKLATWNAGNCCGLARDNNVDDVGFVRAILKSLPEQVHLDQRRVFATGMSNGGMFSHRLACEMADVFKAVAPVAGTDGSLQCKPSRPISVLQIHAKNDTHVLFNGGAGPDSFRDTSKVAEFVSVPETMARWAQRNQCQSTPKRSVTVPGAYCEVYPQCAGGVQVQLCVTETGGHSWPGASKARRGKEAPSQALSANDLMWEFFQR
jgi:polyhydroxybutyrate depolymerase